MRHTPVVVGRSHELSAREEARISRYEDTLTLSRPQTLEDLVDATAVFLHRSDVGGFGTSEQPRDSAPGDEQVFVDRRILIVDDDVRNVFALTSALEQHNLDVLYAESGEEGLSVLRREPDIDLVLMDVMMPGLDGIDTMRIVRQLDGYKSLPIIAVTAKAMVGDRDKCIEAGASDYLAKPVNVDVLLATLWRTLHGQAA